MPWRVGKSDVRKGKPLISPRTLKLPREPQVLKTSKGIQTIVQPRSERMRSRVARKDFLAKLRGFDLDGVFCICRIESASVPGEFAMRDFSTTDGRVERISFCPGLGPEGAMKHAPIVASI